MNLYNKYRPRDFNEMVGDSIIINNLKAIISQKDKPHTYLFTGPPGCGKTTAALICAHKYIDDAVIIEINSANNRGIDTAREIIEQIQGKPISGSNWVYIINEPHKTTKDWQEAMLSPLEFASEYVYFFLTTTNPEMLTKQLRSRCEQIKFNPINPNSLCRLLGKISRKEGKDIDEEVLEEIAFNCEGSARNALILLEKVLNIKDKKEALYIIKKGIESEIPEIKRICNLLLNKNTSWNEVSNILQTIKDKEVENVRRLILGYMTKVLFDRDNRKAAVIMESFLDPFYTSGFPGLVYACYQALNL
jgi:DNA polymerase III gamma/tau subunit